MNDLPLNAPVLVRIGATVCHGILCQRNARGNCLIRFSGSNSERWVKASCVSLAPQRVYTRLLAIALDLLRQSETPRMNSTLKIDGWALNSEYFTAILHQLRDDSS